MTVEDFSDKVDCLLVTGPKAREVLDQISDADLSLPWLSVQYDATVAGKACALIRVSYAGELGWEIHCDPDDAPAIWGALTVAGAKPFGMFALDSLRIEKGYRTWKGDLSSDYTLLEAGLDRFVDLSKPHFRGKAALTAQAETGVKKRSAPLIVEAQGCDAPPMATVWHNGQVVGEVTSSAWGYRVGASVALAMLRTDLTIPGTEVEVDIFGTLCKATVRSDSPLWDPKNERIRA